MSAVGAVLFPSGKVGWFEMHTICPGWYSTVYADYEESRKNWHTKEPRQECRCGEKQRIRVVAIAEVCGSDLGWSWPGVACENCMQFLGACGFEGQEEVYFEFKKVGVPEWFEEAWRKTVKA